MSSCATAGMDLFNCLPIVGAVCTAVPGASLLRTAETRVFVWRTHCRSVQRKNNRLKSHRRWEANEISGAQQGMGSGEMSEGVQPERCLSAAQAESEVLFTS